MVERLSLWIPRTERMISIKYKLALKNVIVDFCSTYMLAVERYETYIELVPKSVRVRSVSNSSSFSHKTQEDGC